jgi:hypothetical protein
MKYIEHDSSGQIVATISASFPVELSANQIEVSPGIVFDAHTHYVQNDELVPFPSKPSPHHDWDWVTKSWLPNLDAARASKLQQVSVELNARLYLPCNGFDADAVSRERISGTIARLQRGDGLPAGWLGWRDASNQQRWAEDNAATVLANLTALSCAIEDREQALLITSWQHKANLNALEDFNAILSYDTTAGWPS